MAVGKGDTDLASVDIHDVLSNERRQMTIELLRQQESSMTARELSEQIAEQETGESPPPRNIRQSAYVSLHQTHLPKLDDLGIVDYDQSAKTVELNERAEQVSVYLETVPKYGLSWGEYYVGMAVVGLLLVAGAEMGVPWLSAIGVSGWAMMVFALIGVSGAYQTVRQESSILHRLRRS